MPIAACRNVNNFDQVKHHSVFVAAHRNDIYTNQDNAPVHCNHVYDKIYLDFACHFQSILKLIPLSIGRRYHFPRDLLETFAWNSAAVIFSFRCSCSSIALQTAA